MLARESAPPQISCHVNWSQDHEHSTFVHGRRQSAATNDSGQPLIDDGRADDDDSLATTSIRADGRSDAGPHAGSKQ